MSYVYKSFDVNTFDFSPLSTIIPVDPFSIPYFVAKSGLDSAVTTSVFILLFTFVYCFAKSTVGSSSEYPTKYIFTSFSTVPTLSLLPCVSVYNLSWLKSNGSKFKLCTNTFNAINTAIIIAINPIVVVPFISHFFLII